MSNCEILAHHLKLSVIIKFASNISKNESSISIIHKCKQNKI